MPVISKRMQDKDLKRFEAQVPDHFHQALMQRLKGSAAHNLGEVIDQLVQDAQARGFAAQYTPTQGNRKQGVDTHVSADTHDFFGRMAEQYGTKASKSRLLMDLIDYLEADSAEAE